MYGNGPGYKKVNGSRPDLRDVDTSKASFVSLQQRARVGTSAVSDSVCSPPLRDGIKMLQNGNNEKTIPKKLNWGDL